MRLITYWFRTVTVTVVTLSRAFGASVLRVCASVHVCCSLVWSVFGLNSALEAAPRAGHRTCARRRPHTRPGRAFRSPRPDKHIHDTHTHTRSSPHTQRDGWAGVKKSPHTLRRRGGQRAREALHRCCRSDCESKIRSRFPRALSRSLAISRVPPSATDSPAPSAPDSLVSRLRRESSIEQRHSVAPLGAVLSRPARV